jgi:hypothetical protein
MGPRFARLVGALALLLLLAPPGFAQKRGGEAVQRVQLVNRTLATVREVYLAPTTADEWGEDRLGAAVLEPGEEAEIKLSGGCAADLRIVYPGGAAEERRGLDICARPRIVLRPGWVLAENLDEDSVPPAMPPAGGVLRLRNLGPLPIVELYAAPPGAPRGEDRLGADILPIGGEMEIEPDDANECEVDLIAVFRDGREVTRRGVDLCGGEEIELR